MHVAAILRVKGEHVETAKPERPVSYVVEKFQGRG